MLRFHSPLFMEASAWATFRLRAAIRAMPCSAAAMVLAVGALTTRQPYCSRAEFQISCQALACGASELENEMQGLEAARGGLQMQRWVLWKPVQDHKQTQARGVM